MTSSRRSSTSNNFRVSKTAKHFAEAVRALFCARTFCFFGAKKFFAHRAKWRAKGKAEKKCRKESRNGNREKAEKKRNQNRKGKKITKAKIPSSIFYVSKQKPTESNRTGNFVRTQATGANIDRLVRAADNCLYTTDIGLPGSVGLSVRVRNIVTEGNTLAADLALCHCGHLLKTLQIHLIGNHISEQRL